VSRTEIPVYAVNRVAYEPYDAVNGDPTNGMYFADNGGYTWLEIDNPGSLPITVGAVVSVDAVDDIVIPDKEIEVDPGSAVHFGPFPKKWYSQPDLSVYFEVDPDGVYGDEGTCLTFSAYELSSVI